MSGSWRAIAEKTIAAVIKSIGASDEKALRKAISEAYPFGQRSNHPYDVWRSEVKRQMAKLGFLSEREKKLAASYRKRGDI